MDRALVRPADQRPLDAAMLIAERDFQVKHVLAVALKAKVSRLDHAGVDRADGDLVDLLAVDAEEVGHAGHDGGADGPRPGVVSRAVGGVEANRLEPGMPARARRPTARRFRARTNAPADNRASAPDSCPTRREASSAIELLAAVRRARRTAARACGLARLAEQGRNRARLGRLRR